MVLDTMILVNYQLINTIFYYDYACHPFANLMIVTFNSWRSQVGFLLFVHPFVISLASYSSVLLTPPQVDALTNCVSLLFVSQLPWKMSLTYKIHRYKITMRSWTFWLPLQRLVLRSWESCLMSLILIPGFLGGSVVKNPPAIQDRHIGSIPGWGRYHEEGKPLPYSCLENPMDRGAWWATVLGIAKELDMT